MMQLGMFNQGYGDDVDMLMNDPHGFGPSLLEQQ